MTDKAYIVVNKEQELNILKKFEQNGLVWLPGDNPTDWLPSESSSFENFPYVLIEKGYVTWSSILRIKDQKVVYDRRKEDEEVYTRYNVTQEFMKELANWRDKEDIDATIGRDYNYVWISDFETMPRVTIDWLVDDKKPIERNNRLIAIVQWLNGEDVFEVEKTHKFVVRSKEIHSDGYYSYVKVVDQMALHTDYNLAMKFDTREEAQEWANSHQVVVEIDADGNEVE